MTSIIELMKELPEGYEAACYAKKAIQRKRGIENPNDLMMLSMFHLFKGCSLVEISAIGKLAKLGNVSDVAFMKRFENCNDWFAWNAERLISDCAIEYEKPDWIEEYRVLAVDASEVYEKGCSRRSYRLHFALDLFKMCCEEYKITTQKTGESLRNFEIKEGDLIVGDRIYSTLGGIKHCLDNGANFVMRIRNKAFNLYDAQNERINLPEHLEKLKDEEILDLRIFARLDGKAGIPLRICAMRKNPEAIDKTQRYLVQKQSRAGRKFSEEALAFNNYIVVITALPDSISAGQILELYRWRWQVELYFKRLKSIMDFGEMPKKRPQSVFAWLNGKMMIALLIEKIIGKPSFSPEIQRQAEHLA